MGRPFSSLIFRQVAPPSSDRYVPVAERLAPFVADTGRAIRKAWKENKSILFEGAMCVGQDLSHLAQERHSGLGTLTIHRLTKLSGASRAPQDWG